MPRYTVRQRLVALGRDYGVHDESGELAFVLDGKLRFARSFSVKDRDGKLLLGVREKLLCIDPTFVITSAAAAPVAVVKRTSTSDASVLAFEIEDQPLDSLALQA